MLLSLNMGWGRSGAELHPYQEHRTSSFIGSLLEIFHFQDLVSRETPLFSEDDDLKVSDIATFTVNSQFTAHMRRKKGTPNGPGFANEASGGNAFLRV